MGAFCCCARGDDFDEYAYPSNSIYSHCICLRVFFHQLITGMLSVEYLINVVVGVGNFPWCFQSRSAFHRLEGRPATSQIHGATLASSVVTSASVDSTANETHISVSRPLPYDAEQRYSHLQRDGLVSRREKSMSHFQEDSQPVRRNLSGSGVESLGLGKRRNGVDSEEESKFGHESSEKALTAKISAGLIYTQTSSEDEDVCPTCLEEYTPENPKITTQCSHHFHLGCIYEWMERSESCPICGKEMEFCESP